MDYLLAVQAPAYPIGPERFAIESAFAIHLKMLADQLGPRFDRIVLLAPTLSDETYERAKSQLTQLSAVDDRIVLLPFPETGLSAKAFWGNARSIWRRLRGAVRSSGFVHTGLSSDIYRPLLAMLNLATWLERKPSVFMVDIDFREMSRRNYRLGVWGRKSYLSNRAIHDNFRLWQVKWAIRKCDLVLLKSQSMVKDLGGGSPHVKFFLDAAHADSDVISDAELDQHLARLADPNRELQAVYFGRLVPYKGCEYMIEAVAAARAQGARVAMTFIGDGECLPQLKKLAIDRGLADAVTFLPPVVYGAPLFNLIGQCDFAAASPKSEDTPRAALDAMARGLPIVAFDIDYFKSLADMSGAVALATWPEPDSLADAFKRLDRERPRIAEMSRNAVAFARVNSQDIWLQRRIAWTFEALDRRMTAKGAR